MSAVDHRHQDTLGKDAEQDARRQDALAPVREALLAAARHHAADLVAAAEREAEETVERARQEADAARAEARAQGAADAESVLVWARTRSRREARGTVLAARQEAYQELRRRVRAQVTGLRDHPGYPALLHRLEAQAREALGPDARVEEAPEGGVLATSATRRFERTLPDLAEEALASLEAELAELWSG